MPLTLILAGTLLAAVSGWPGLFTGRRTMTGQYISVALMSIAAVFGLVGAGIGLGAAEESLILPWRLLENGARIALDPLSAFFLIPVFAMGGLGAVYGLGYWRQTAHVMTGRYLRLFWGLMVAGMATLILARNGILFLFGWEIMALSAFFLIVTEGHRGGVRKAAWLYLIATHIGTLSLFAMFALLRHITGTFDLAPLDMQQASLGLLWVVFALGLLGFGLKAGLMPLHFWLPSAHASAPSHVSAILSGVMIKMGIYGLVRICWLLPNPPLAWGGIFLILGSVSAVLGVASAIGQHDLKRLLAYHSVENIGIIAMGLGLAMAGRTLGRNDWIALGMAGALLHVWNHGLFKSLLFLGAGSVVHASHTREIDRLGGLASRMPWTAGFFLLGAVAICGLPPLNGFVSELFIYLGLLRTVDLGDGASWTAAALAVPVLALTGALAAACFVKVYGVVFLGTPRSNSASNTHESPLTMLVPISALAAGCVLIGIAPWAVAPVLQSVLGSTAIGIPSAGEPLTDLAPLVWIGFAGPGAMLFGVLVWLTLRNRIRIFGEAKSSTWGCGYHTTLPRAQYTASSFGQMIILLFRRVMPTQTHRPETGSAFPKPSRFESHITDAALDKCFLPTAKRLQSWLLRFRRFQQGQAQQYLLYILVSVMALLTWAMPFKEIFKRLFAR